MKECIIFLLIMSSLISGMAIGQWGIKTKHQNKINQMILINKANQAAHEAEEARIQLAYQLQCQDRVADAVYQINEQTTGKWHITLKPWLPL